MQLHPSRLRRKAVAALAAVGIVTSLTGALPVGQIAEAAPGDPTCASGRAVYNATGVLPTTWTNPSGQTLPWGDPALTAPLYAASNTVTVSAHQIRTYAGLGLTEADGFPSTATWAGQATPLLYAGCVPLPASESVPCPTGFAAYQAMSGNGTLAGLSSDRYGSYYSAAFSYTTTDAISDGIPVSAYAGPTRFSSPPSSIAVPAGEAPHFRVVNGYPMPFVACVNDPRIVDLSQPSTASSSLSASWGVFGSSPGGGLSTPIADGTVDRCASLQRSGDRVTGLRWPLGQASVVSYVNIAAGAIAAGSLPLHFSQVIAPGANPAQTLPLRHTFGFDRLGGLDVISDGFVIDGVPVPTPTQDTVLRIELAGAVGSKRYSASYTCTFRADGTVIQGSATPASTGTSQATAGGDQTAYWGETVTETVTGVTPSYAETQARYISGEWVVAGADGAFADPGEDLTPIWRRVDGTPLTLGTNTREEGALEDAAYDEATSSYAINRYTGPAQVISITDRVTDPSWLGRSITPSVQAWSISGADVTGRHFTPEDPAQVIRVVAPVLTSQASAGGDQTVEVSETLSDAVSYTGLGVGVEYTMYTEWQRLNADGTHTPTGMRAAVTFVPTANDGSVVVTTGVVDPALDGVTLVAFDELYLGARTADEIAALSEEAKAGLVGARHEDPAAASQTLRWPVPVVTTTTTVPAETTTTTTTTVPAPVPAETTTTTTTVPAPVPVVGGALPKTGGGMSTLPLASVGLALGLAVMALARRSRSEQPAG